MKKMAAASSIVAVGLTLIAIATPLGANLWSLASGQGFFIPEESSVFWFEVTKVNKGSGEWWLYGRDEERLFAVHPSEPVYLSAALASQIDCANFKADDFTTWCSPEQHPLPQQ